MDGIISTEIVSKILCPKEIFQNYDKYIQNVNAQKKYKMKMCLAVPQYKNGSVLEADLLVLFY